jgi:transposase
MTDQALHHEHTTEQAALYMSFELADKRWKLTFGDHRRSPSRYTIAAADTEAFLRCAAKARERFGIAASAPLHTCYEAGRDGWWLHRWLTAQGIHNIVVDASSIEVSRRRRRAKSDGIDGDALLERLMRYHGGEKKVWAVLHEPTPQQEDARRPSRELSRLTREQTQHSNRIGALLVLHNLRGPGRVGGRAWNAWFEQQRAGVPPNLLQEIDRELARLALVREHIRALEAQQRRQHDPMVRQLSTLRAIAQRGASVLVAELFGWRHFANRREVGACLGMTPTPYNSGDSHIEQGISKAGNKRARTLIVELAWRWLTLQPHSDLTAWFNRRFAHGGKRLRRIGIVALARRLAIDLWRFLEHGEIPAGAVLKQPRTA